MVIDSQFKRPPADKVITAYKVMEVRGGRYFFPYYHNGPSIKTGVWLEANTAVRLYLNDPTKSYRSGFHVFETKEAAKEYKTRPWCVTSVLTVRVRGVHTRGSQGPIGGCLVADYIYFPKRKKK
jgi:hypothetical protein